MKKTFLPSLTSCIILDAIGCASYLFPLIGEAIDLVWAPISGIIFYFMFGRKMGVFGGVFSFLEELTPGLDIIPTFTIAWFIRKNEIEKEEKTLRLPARAGR
ncbi:MAG: hypothetical protein ABIR19_01820 [Ginsengibacter sp.]